jgi:hypothetical protein
MVLKKSASLADGVFERGCIDENLPHKAHATAATRSQTALAVTKLVSR